MASQWVGSMPPPPGVEPNLVDPPSRLSNNIALHTVCLTLTSLLLATRLYTRIAINKTGLGLDDYFCVTSWGLSIAFSALMIKSYTYGVGRHIWDEPASWLVDALKWFSIANCLYLVLTACIKLTFLIFYYRIFSPQVQMRYWIIGGMIVVTCLNTGLFFATVFKCAPVTKEWSSYLPGHCLNHIILPYLSGVSSSATDIFILVLPIRLLWNLNMSLDRRLRISAVFGVGIL
ncbi:hypothetical protein VM1G_07521 [Cytospora mali]|uniref:Rhodopsin domain-containing protein n=1 Tax=Cytospora mali TaxID=578113 RepID=A0A194W7J4_CYTMA|nr:hypothetical protein VM1G_07521 [Valsa mali]